MIGFILSLYILLIGLRQLIIVFQEEAEAKLDSLYYDKLRRKWMIKNGSVLFDQSKRYPVEYRSIFEKDKD